MVSCGIPQEDGGRNTKGASMSQRTILSGQTVLSCGSVALPARRGRPRRVTPRTPNKQKSFLRLSHAEISEDDGFNVAVVNQRKRKRAPSHCGRGLRQFSMRVCEKVQSKGRSTYNEVADELVAEYAGPGDGTASSDQRQFEEKNIRRRVYVALNVLMAMDVIIKHKKEMFWKGLPCVTVKDLEDLKAKRMNLRSRIEKRIAFLQELQGQFSGYENLIKRNRRLYGDGSAAPSGVALPFILVQTRPNATVEVEISEDMRLVHFDFNSIPFELRDDNYVFKKMERFQNSSSHGVSALGERSGMPSAHLYQTHDQQYSNTPVSSPAYPLPSEVPKAHVKQEF